MLSRTADHLFWMARYTERAESTARMLNVNVETALLPQSEQAVEQAWRSMLGISELQSRYDRKYQSLTQKNVLDFMVRDLENPSSIVSCLTRVRENARAVRGTLTTEVWETHNATWLVLQQQLQSGLLDYDPGRFFEWVKYRAHLARGVTLGTMLKDEAFHFIRLGTFLERADNTARLLDVKFHEAPGSGRVQAQTQGHGQFQSQGQMPIQIQGDLRSREATRFDFYYWASILRSVSGFEIYRKVYRDVITPGRVAELLMLRPDMPRSLVASLEEVVSNLQQVRNDASAETERLAGQLYSELKFGHIDEILDSGLHDYLTRFLERIYGIGNRISRDFLMPSAA